MSRIVHMATTDAAANVHVREPGHRYLTFPFRFADSEVIDAPAAPALGFYPFRITLDRAMEWWWRFRKFSLGFELQTDHPSTDISRTASFTRESSVAEIDLILPGGDLEDTVASPLSGPFRYTGGEAVEDWNGSGGILEWSGEVCLFFKAISPVTESIDQISERMYWRTDDDTILPSVVIDIRGFYTTPGTEVSFKICNFLFVNPSSNAIEFTGEALSGYGGGLLGCKADADVVLTGAEATVAPAVGDGGWWPYAKPDSSLPIWNTNTGAQLLDPRTGFR